MIRWHFREVVIKNEMPSPGRAVLLVGNHWSWWDGFIACYINQKVFRKKFHVMMLEEQLRPRMFLSKAGAFSIRPGARDMVDTLQYTAALLGDDHNMVAMYPQGSFNSVHDPVFRFEKGVSVVDKKSRAAYSLVFCAALVDYFSHRRPGLTIYLEEAERTLAGDHRALEAAYNDFFSRCVKQQKSQ